MDEVLKNKPLQINVLEGDMRLTASRNQHVFHHLEAGPEPAWFSREEAS